MGVPSFYKWLVDKYPKIVVKAVEELGDDIHQCVDTTSPNPNGMEFDNLYLDMNGIIHPCFHPDDDDNTKDLPKTFDEVFNDIYGYIDRIFSIVRPRKLLFMAIDGVAPRAKMNQQRSRRFRTAKDKEIADAEEYRLRREFEMEGQQVPPKEDSEVSDSNIITPGTLFMFELSRKLQSYISSRMNADSLWKNIKVILSDSNVPGEGEHKIMSFIREQRTFKDYDPNTRHCLYGLDADLIMLALSTHEVHFSILREDVLSQETQLKTNSFRGETNTMESRGSFKDVRTEGWSKDKTIIKNKKPYEFLHVWILREYLEFDMKISDPPKNFTFDIERIVDDFIFMCFFVGNDFLPHTPSLEIHESAIDLLITIYKENFKNLGGYLVDTQRASDPKNGFVKLKRVEKFILQVGSYEEKIFKRRSELREKKLRRLCEQEQQEFLWQDEEGKLCGNLDLGNNSSSYHDFDGLNGRDMVVENTKELKEKLKNCLRQKADLFKAGALSDRVKLGTVDWRKRYYKEKFSVESSYDIESTRKDIVEKYTHGLLWVLLYYFSGVPSWTWYYPYHYGPFCSDLKGLAQVKVKFEKGSPFKPFDQLMGVLPPRSAHALPKAYQALMTHENSPIIDFYPREFDIDTDGKRFAWQGICKLSFINEERLLAETRKFEKDLESHETQRNAENVEKLFVGRSVISESQFSLFVSKLVSGRSQDLVRMDASLSCGLSGSMSFCPDEFSTIDATFENIMNNIKERDVICVRYELPEGSVHIPRPLAGVKFPEKTVSEDDIEERQLWHEYAANRNPRLHIQDKQGNSYKRIESALNWTNRRNDSKLRLNLEPIHKWAGTGWRVGGGRANSTHEIRDFNDLKISESTQSNRPSGNGALYNANNGWCQNSPFHCSSSVQSGGGIQWVLSRNTATCSTNNAWHQNPQFHSSSSVQSGGGIQRSPSINTATYNTNNAWLQNPQFHSIAWHQNPQLHSSSSVQSGGGIQRSQSINTATYNTNNVWLQNPQFHSIAWHQNSQFHSSSSVPRGRGIQCGSSSTYNQNSLRHHNAHMAQNPSRQASSIGRGNNAPRTYSMDWRSSRTDPQNHCTGYNNQR